MDNQDLCRTRVSRQSQFFYTQTKHHASRHLQCEQRELGANAIGLTVLKLCQVSCNKLVRTVAFCHHTVPDHAIMPNESITHGFRLLTANQALFFTHTLSLSSMQTLLEMQETMPLSTDSALK